jgi:lipid-A-disaccharide synthase
MSLTAGQCAFISVGEYSGDLLGAELVLQLKKEFPKLDYFGVTGPALAQSRVTSIASIDELNVMGIVEVARKISDIREVERRVLAWIDRLEPRFAVLVDFPGFHFQLAEQLKLRGIPVFQYVAPKLWAWGRGRVEGLKRDFTKVLGVLPFEEDFFTSQGVRYEYVGSPHADRMSKIQVSARDLGLKNESPIIAFMPGSRKTEVDLIFPHMIDVRNRLKSILPEAQCVVPIADSLSWSDFSGFFGCEAKPHGDEHKMFFAHDFWWMSGGSLELMKVSTAALVASGTATLECALAETPMVVIYVMNDMSYAIAKRMVSLKWVSLVNLLMNRSVVSEHIQDINTAKIAEELVELTQESPRRRVMKEHLRELTLSLKPQAAANAAKSIRLSMECV